MNRVLVRTELFELLNELKADVRADSIYKCLSFILKEHRYFNLYRALVKDFGDDWEFKFAQLWHEGYIEETTYYVVAVPVGDFRYQYLMKTLNGVRIGGIVSEFKVPPIRFKEPYIFSSTEIDNLPHSLEWAKGYLFKVTKENECD